MIGTTLQPEICTSAFQLCQYLLFFFFLCVPILEIPYVDFNVLVLPMLTIETEI
jgi:hypothetical protein